MKVIVCKNMNKKIYLLIEALSSNETFVIINNEFFFCKMLLFFTCASRMFAIYLSRFKQHHLNLDALLNKDFKSK